jgi:hypothetical protein
MSRKRAFTLPDFARKKFAQSGFAQRVLITAP